VKRNKNLDALRAVAVLMVLGAHFEINWLWKRVGWLGVDLFFVLSGYLVSGLLFNEFKTYGKIRVANFFARRGLKIYPAFYTLMLCTILWQIFMVHELPLKNLAAELFFFQNYVYGLLWHTWSLAVEEHFYLVLPISLLVMIKRGQAKRAEPFAVIPTLFVVVASLALIGRIIYFWVAPDSPQITRATHLRLDSLAFGVLLSYYSNFRKDDFNRLLNSRLLPIVSTICMVACLILIVLDATGAVVTIGLTLGYLGFGGLMLIGLREKSDAGTTLIGKLVGILAAIGFYSYSIYLWHMAMKDYGLRATRFVVKHLNISFISSVYSRIEWLVFVVGCVILGIIMAKLVEVPALKLRDRVFPSRSKVTPVTPYVAAETSRSVASV